MTTMGRCQNCGADVRPADNPISRTEGGWRPIETAPKDGTVVELTWMEDGKPQEIWPMQWAHIQKNGLFPGKTGMWTAPDGSVTWNDDIPAGAPTHWRPVADPEESIRTRLDKQHVKSAGGVRTSTGKE